MTKKTRPNRTPKTVITINRRKTSTTPVLEKELCTSEERQVQRKGKG